MEETKKTLDRLDEIAYISDLDTYELLFLNQNGRERFGVPAPGVKCYEHLQHKTSPCDFCTNAELPKCPNKQKTWEREHPTVGTMRLHDSIIDYGGKPRRMEVAFDINRFADDLSAAEGRLAAEKKLVACIEKLVVSRDFTAAVNTMLEMILEHYRADRAYVFEFDWAAHTTKNTYEVCKDGVTPQIDTLQNVPIDAVALWVDIFKHQKNKINIIEDLEMLRDDPVRRMEYDVLYPQGIQSLITVPVFVGDKLHGFLGVDNPRAHMDAPELLTQVTYIAANELEKRQLTEELRFKSYHDALTGLKNRLAYDETLDDLLGKRLPTGVGFLDMNSLKWINNHHGYDMGNKAILLVCKILKAHFPEDCIYRISGDEFVVIWPDADYTQFKIAAGNAATALAAEKQIAALGYVWGHEEDVGIAVRQAEKAMQTEKNKYYAALDGQRDQRPGSVDVLLREFRASTFVPYLQPLYSIQAGKVYGAEILVRKFDPHGKIHNPIDFIRIMENEGMIFMVDFKMLRCACELLQQWKAAWPTLTLNVNFSRNTISEPDFLDRVDAVLAETGTDPTRLVFEVTESATGIDLKALSDVLDGLKARGITLAIDDLGTDASNLNTLRQAQFTYAKLDKSLIDEAEHIERMQTIIEWVIGLAHELGMLCVAEGIETPEQIELLKTLKCDRLQGYMIGKPMPADEFFTKFGPQAGTT